MDTTNVVQIVTNTIVQVITNTVIQPVTNNAAQMKDYSCALEVIEKTAALCNNTCVVGITAISILVALAGTVILIVQHRQYKAESSELEKRIHGLSDEISKNIEISFSSHFATLKKDIANIKSYSSSISYAETALGRNSTIDVEPAITLLSELRPAFKNDRTLHMYLGRLYRKIGRFDLAINVLQDFIHNLDISEQNRALTKRNIADAYYNIACYHALKANDCREKNDNNEADRLEKEALDYLARAVTGNEMNYEASTQDKDFEHMIDKIKKHFSGKNN